jgi:hypothetical protein
MAYNLQRSGSFALLSSELPEKRDATLKRRYYSNLGLDASTAVARKEAKVASPVRTSLPKATVVKLRGDRDDDLLQWLWSLFQAVTSPSSAAAGKKRKVRFSEDVTAVAIPSRDEYSYRVKEQAFHSMVEIHDMVTKVSISYLVSASVASSQLISSSPLLHTCCKLRVFVQSCRTCWSLRLKTLTGRKSLKRMALLCAD